MLKSNQHDSQRQREPNNANITALSLATTYFSRSTMSSFPSQAINRNGRSREEMPQVGEGDGDCHI